MTSKAPDTLTVPFNQLSGAATRVRRTPAQAEAGQILEPVEYQVRGETRLAVIKVLEVLPAGPYTLEDPDLRGQIIQTPAAEAGGEDPGGASIENLHPDPDVGSRPAHGIACSLRITSVPKTRRHPWGPSRNRPRGHAQGSDSSSPDIPAESFLLLGPEGMDPGLAPFESVGPWDGTEPGPGGSPWMPSDGGWSSLCRRSRWGPGHGPSHKPAIQAAGWDVRAKPNCSRTLRAPDVGMLMCAERTQVGGPLRVLLATTHIPLRDLFQHLTADLLLRPDPAPCPGRWREDWGTPKPQDRPLCRESPRQRRGAFRIGGGGAPPTGGGQSFRSEGLSIRGPLPADTVFHRALRGELDAVVAPYHDVGMAAFKSVSFGQV